MTQLDSKIVIQSLKKAIKQKGFKYKDIASAINMSESGLKKFFGAKDYSLKRILDICDVIEVKFEDLINYAVRARPVTKLKLTKRAEKYFYENFDCFKFYWKLVVEKTPLAKIEEEYNLSSNHTFKYLRKLDSFEIIKLMPNDKVILPKKTTLIKWDSGSDLQKKVLSEWSQELVSYAAKNFRDDADVHLYLKYYSLSKESYDELVNDFNSLHTKYAEVSFREEQISDQKQLKKVISTTAIAPKSYIDEI